ncbi:hypothetical protein BT1A1_3225 [Caldibacillus thermoamylovorans]|uniref:Uncharacterized protein n=1 Tax=Caldibacillus thermoamylovorans TaxID=35841 RepID=A0A090J2X7_9BACI|nr:hypothetical protein BT1A1_3225 [Caldibacillus thermoamylovorans]
MANILVNLMLSLYLTYEELKQANKANIAGTLRRLYLTYEELKHLLIWYFKHLFFLRLYLTYEELKRKRNKKSKIK